MARTCFLVIRCTPEERERIHALAQASGETASDLVRRLVLAPPPPPPATPADPSSLRSDKD